MKNRPKTLKHLRKLYFATHTVRKETPGYLTLFLGIGIGILVSIIALGIFDYLARMGKL